MLAKAFLKGINSVMSIEYIDLPAGVCAADFGRSLYGTEFNEVEGTLERTGVGDVVDALARENDIIALCGVAGCSSSVNLSNRAGDLILQNLGLAEYGCIRPGKAPGDPLA
jgi:hypothetical protein